MINTTNARPVCSSCGETKPTINGLCAAEYWEASHAVDSDTIERRTTERRAV